MAGQYREGQDRRWQITRAHAHMPRVGGSNIAVAYQLSTSCILSCKASCKPNFRWRLACPARVKQKQLSRRLVFLVRAGHANHHLKLGLQLGLQLSMQLVFNWYATDNRKSAPGHLELESGPILIKRYKEINRKSGPGQLTYRLPSGSWKSRAVLDTPKDTG